MEAESSYEVICGYMPQKLKEAMKKISTAQLHRLTEIRLRSERKAAFVFPDNIKFLTVDGRLETRSSETYQLVTAEEIRSITEALCRYSVHSCSKELREGFFVIDGGVRVGLAGKVSDTSEKILTDISGLNFRISRCVKGCAEELFLRTDKGTKSVLICGGVNSGKTTLLRDICRLCGNRMKTVLIDERNEISASESGKCGNDVGELTDIICGGKRADGIRMAIRTLSPDMIFCDEISGCDDAEAIVSGYGSGVRFTAAIHAENYDELLHRSTAKPLIETGVFDYAVFLKGSNLPSGIKEIRRLKNDTESTCRNSFYFSRSSSRSGQS